MPYRKQDDTSPQYVLDDYKPQNEFNKKLYGLLQVSIANLGTNERREFTKTYVSYKADTIFVAVFFQKNRLRLCIGMSLNGIYDPKGVCSRNPGWNPAGDVEVFGDGLARLDDVMAIIEQAFRSQDVE